tara:strand:- start:10 stop:972 length:963 start_codon:yes stop_codon:yes gene_type:complete
MKQVVYILIIILGLKANAQVINQSFNHSTEFENNQKQSISVSGNQLKINTRIIYNALPDGYHITYTQTEISETIEELEEITIKKKNSIVKDLKKHQMKAKDLVVDAIGLDPIFNINPDSNHNKKPSGYKSTHNFTFKITELSMVDQLTKICFNHNIYDLIDIVPFIKKSKHIEDSLSLKAIEVLNSKKNMARNIGFEIQDGKPFFENKKNIIYPSERYIKSYINNASLFKHHIAQNATINYNRKVEIDAYYNLDLRDADYVFNAQEVKPVIQFIYEINYGFIKRDREEEARIKAARKSEKEEKKTIFILDKNGKMREVKF